MNCHSRICSLHFINAEVNVVSKGSSFVTSSGVLFYLKQYLKKTSQRVVCYSKLRFVRNIDVNRRSRDTTY